VRGEQALFYGARTFFMENLRSAVVVDAVLEHMQQHPSASLGVDTLNSERRR
jgi:hypothetical protein